LRIKRHFEEKNGECAACLKYSVLIFVEKIYKMQHLVGGVTPVLHRGRMVVNSEFPLRLDYGRSPNAYVNQIELELLMMSRMPLETC